MRKCNSNGYVMVHMPKHPRTHESGWVLEHRLFAEKALGKPLPKGVQVHHHGERNDNTQLVICENQEYHALLHTRTSAIRDCGHVDWRKCRFCKKHDKPENLYVSPNNRCVHHLTCFNIWQGKYREQRKLNGLGR